MLTKEHAIVVYERGRAIPDRLSRGAHRHYVAYAAKMLAVYRAGAGRTRRDLHRSVEGIFADEPDCPARRLHAFCKLLDDAGEYEEDLRGRAAALRLQVFDRAARFHPLVRETDRLFETGEAEAKARIARDLGRPWEAIESELYADVIDLQRLRAFLGYPSPEALLSRYNVAQVQACLYRAERMSIVATGDFKTILRYAKLARLLHEIERVGPSRYRLDLAGPASVLGETRRYGVALACFFPALLACRGWEMQAIVRAPWGGKARLALSWQDGLSGGLPAPDTYDSKVEEKFAKKFGAKRDGWRLLREAEILFEGQLAFVPDFVFRHEDGTEVLFEIVGYWTPEYLARKRDLYRRFRDRRIFMAVPASSLREGAEIPGNVIVYKTALTVKPILEALDRFRKEAVAKADVEGPPAGGAPA